MPFLFFVSALFPSHPARGAWIEILGPLLARRAFPSHPARGAWIEIDLQVNLDVVVSVAPRKGCVD